MTHHLALVHLYMSVLSGVVHGEPWIRARGERYFRGKELVQPFVNRIIGLPDSRIQGRDVFLAALNCSRSSGMGLTGCAAS